MSTYPTLDVNRIPETWLRAYAWVAGAVCAVAVITHLATYGPPEAADTLTALTLAVFPLIFPVFGVAVIVTAFGRVNLGRLVETIPTPAKVLALLLVAYIFVYVFLMLQHLPGQPIEQGGRFYLNHHGGVIPISFQAYRQSLMYQARRRSGLDPGPPAAGRDQGSDRQAEPAARPEAANRKRE